MGQINLVQGKGRQGTSVVACAVALQAAGEACQVRLDGHDRVALAAILGARGDGPVTPGLRPCYLALRQALNRGVAAATAGIVVVIEPGRALGSNDVAAVTGLPVIATVPLRAEIARAVDAGVFADRLPEPLAATAHQILQLARTSLRGEVA